MIARIAAIVRADVMIRFRRFSTAVVFLILSGFAYVWVPAPSTGRALLRVGSARVINNSSAVSIGTAMLAAMFVGLFGFYVVSNAIGRDVRTRCGSIVASTGVRNVEYILGKFAGNVAFLLTFTGGFMLVSMAMVVARGEGRLEPLTFLWNYALLVPSTVFLVSALAIVFESIPPLSGRGGDVLYFFVWLILMSVSAALLVKKIPAAEFLDFQGFALVFRDLRAAFGTTSFSIGAGPFDPKVPAVTLTGLRPGAVALGYRFVATIWPLALLPLALLSFHRFDPARVKARGKHGGAGWIARFDQLFKPLTRFTSVLRARGAVAADAVMTLTAHPLAFVAVVIVMVVGTTTPKSLPIAFAAAAVFVSDVATRDRSAGTFALISAAPRLRERFVLWKFASTLVVVIALLGVPVSRLLLGRPTAAASMLAGLLLITAGAVAFGLVAGTPKAFIVLFLSFWYLVTNDRGATPALDFAGFYGRQPMAITFVYLALSAALLAAAEIVHRARLRG